MWSNQVGLTTSRLESRPMPKRRFDKLDPQVRERILQAAALEFGTHGYADASLNRIVEQAGISKGSMYYYFEDKEDVFSMVLQDLEARSADLIALPLDALTADTYWATVNAVFRAWLQIAVENPWVQGFLQLFSEMLRNPPTEGPLVAWYERMECRRSDFVRKGQELGVVRRDLPVVLLTDLMHGVQMVQGRYFMKNSVGMGPAERERMASIMIDVMQRILSPAPGSSAAGAAAGSAAVSPVPTSEKPPAAPARTGRTPKSGPSGSAVRRSSVAARRGTPRS